VLATNGIDLPVLNTFRMFSKMSGRRVAVTSSHEIPLNAIIQSGVRGAQPDVTALASLDVAARRMAVMVWHYHDDDVPGPDADVALALTGLPAAANGTARLSHWRVDDDHSNAFTVWKKMGSPAGPNATQYRELVAAGQLAALPGAPTTVTFANGAAELKFSLPRQGVSLVLIEWGAATN
jgi:xylan 1,4-beta-xylosidase